MKTVTVPVELIEKLEAEISGGLCYFSAESKHCQLKDAMRTVKEILTMITGPADPTAIGCNPAVEGRPKLDTKRMRACSPLLPAPGGEVVRECLDEIESLQSELSESRAECERLRRGEFICTRCGLRKDAEASGHADF